MKRRQFIQAGMLGFGAMGTLSAMQLSQFKNRFNEETDVKMPVLFVGHGNPMNAIEDNEFSRTWTEIGKKLIVPKAILCVSAHWLTKGTGVCAVPHPETIHDFGGFPQALFDVQYNAPGAPDFAEATKQLITKTNVALDFEWGLDHGCWSVLNKMFPAATIPVYQLSIDYYATPQYNYELAQQLKDLRKKGVLIIGSGNIVHNLRMAQFTDFAYDWAIEFDEKIKGFIQNGDHQSIIDYPKLGQAAKLSVPTNDHYLPLLYSLALQEKDETLAFFNEKTTAGAISMRSLIIG